MTRTEMIGFARENPYVKITHYLFSKDEYIYSKGDGCIYEEHGYLFDDFTSNCNNGIRMRSGDLWETGWSLYEKVPTKQTKYSSWQDNYDKFQRRWKDERFVKRTNN